MKQAHVLRTLALIALLLVTPVLLFGQAVNFASIHGRVADKSDAAIPGAQVKATQVNTGLVRTTTTTSDGNYSLPNLPVGEYKVEVTAKGFREYIQKGITLTVGSTAAVNPALEVGSVTETVEVHADAAMVETHENSIQTLIDNNRIMEMPLNGRSVSALLMLSGAASDAAPINADINSSKNFGNGQTGQQNQTVTVSVGGSQQNSNNFILDGGDNNDAFSNVNAPLPFPDAIQEFSVQTSGLSARYGKQAGAVVNAITKSGTNNFHGSAFEFLRNPLLNAKHVVFTGTPPVRDDTMKRNQFGGTFGGPVKKDKLMFFGAFQGTRTRYSPPPTSAIIPTAAVLNGDFSTILSTACKSSAVNLKSAYGFTGNTISPTAFSPQAVALAHYLPISQADQCGRVSYTIPQVTDEEQVVSKVDWNISQKQQAFARYFIVDQRNPVQFDASNILTQATSSQFSRFQTIVLGDTYTLDSGIVNSARVMFKRMAVNRGPASDMISFKDLGVDVDTPIPNGMVLGVSNYFNVGGGSSMPLASFNNAYQFSDDVDILKGKHQISFGGNWMKLQLNYLSTFQENGQFTFGAGSARSGDNLADFMLGLPSSFTQGNPEWENWRMDYIGLYIHDNYKVLPNLTLNLGVRWEPYLPSMDTAHRGSHFDYDAFVAGTHSAVYPNAPAGLLYCGDKGVSCAFQERKWKQFAPRVGLIWDPRGQGKETIRAGYGIFYDSPEMYYFDRYADNSPFGSGVSFTPLGTAGSNSFAAPWAGSGQTRIAWPTPFPQGGSSTGVFPLNGVYINNDTDVKPMNAQNWNLSIEKQFGVNWSFSATYLGSKSTHVWFAYEANPGLNQAVASNVGPNCTVGAAATTNNVNCRRALYVANPDQGKYFSNITTLWDGADSSYHGLLLTAKHRFSNNFTAMTNYTWSRCISDADFSGEVTNSRPTLWPAALTDSDPNKFDRLADRGNCSFDVRQSLNGSMVITSPKRNGFLGVIANNWQLAPMITYRTGFFFTVTSGVDTALTGAKTGGFLDRPNQVGDPGTGTCTVGLKTYSAGDRFCWFNTSAFAGTTAADVIAPYGQFGNVRRDSLSGPGAFNFNVSTSRKFAVAEGKELVLRFEAFNVLNHPNLALPTAARNSSNFGQIRSQNGDGRILQAAVKFSF